MPKKLLTIKKRLLLFVLFSFLLIFNCYLLTVIPVSAAPGDAPNPQPCKNAINDPEKLTDNYITQPNGDPPTGLRFTVTGTGVPGTSVPPADLLRTLNPASGTFTVDFSQLQAIFGSQNSNYLEGAYQNQDHRDVNLQKTQGADFNSYHGPGQKSAPIVLTDQLRVKYVTYLYSKPELPESVNKYSDINGANPKTIYEMVKTPFPFPPVPPSLGGDKATWATTWGMYWEKIPTAYSEFYLGKLEFRATAGKENVNRVQRGEYCPMPLRTIEFVMPDFFRTTATSGELNQIVVPNAAQSKDSNNMVLTAAINTKNAFSSFIQRCVYLATQNPLSKKLHKIVSEVIKIANPVKDVYAVNRATSLVTNQTGCGGTGKVSAVLSWTRADDPSGGLPIQDQEMEISLNSSFSAGVTQTVALTASQSSKTFTDFFTPSTDYWWRVHTQYFGSWTTGDNVVSFTSNSCTPTCVFSPTTVTAGNTVGIITNNFTIDPIPVNLVGIAFGNVISVGTIPKAGGSVTIPASTSGDYEVRLGNSGATTTCTGTLTVNAPAVTCSYTGSNPAISGNQITVTYRYTIAGDSVVLASRLSGAVLQTFGTTQDSFGGSKSATYTLSAPGGGYTIFIQTPGPIITNVVNCGDIDITAPTPTCVFSPTTITAGGAVGIITNNFSINPIPTRIVGTAYGNIIELNTIPNSGGSVTIPAGTSGTYIVKAGNIGTDTACTSSSGGILTVTADILPPSCSYTGSNPAINGNSITVTYQGTIAGDSVVLASRLSGAVTQTFGSTQDSLTSAKTATYTLSAPGGGYSVVIQTPGPIITNAATCGDIDITASAVGCVFSPTTITAGGAVGIITNNFSINPIPTRIVGTAYGNIIELNTIPNSGGSVTIPAGTSGTYIVKAGNIGTDTACTSSSGGILTVNAAACVFSPATILLGENLGIITNNFPAGDLNVKIAGTIFGNVVALGTIPNAGGSVAIPIVTPAPQQYDVLVGPAAGPDTKCTGTLQVNQVAGGNNKATPISVNQTGCALNTATGNQMVTATFTWTPADNPIIVGGASIPVLYQFLDYSVFNNNFAVDGNGNKTYQGQDVGINTNTYTFTGHFAPNIDYYWRINTNYYPGGPAAWSPSATATFKTINCAPGDVTFDPLSPNSCIKNPKSSKNSEAPYCALPLKNQSGQDNLTAAEAASCQNKADTNKLDTDNPRVICTFTITWTTNQSFYIPKDGEDLGPWDSCVGDNSNKTCKSTIAVWPDFRIPLLAEVWNNSLYSEKDISTNGTNETGTPGVYSFFTPKSVSGNNIDVNFTDTQVAQDILNCITTVLPRPPDKNNPYCKDLLQIISTLSQISAIQGCNGLNTILDTPPTPEQIDTLRNCASASFVALNLKLPGNVNNQPTNNVKQRFIGATDCFKSFVRDVALKPLELQKSLKIEQGCKATSSP